MSESNLNLKAFVSHVEMALNHPDFSRKRLIYSLHKYCSVDLNGNLAGDLPTIMFRLVLPSMLEEAPTARHPIALIHLARQLPSTPELTAHFLKRLQASLPQPSASQLTQIDTEALSSTLELLLSVLAHKDEYSTLVREYVQKIWEREFLAKIRAVMDLLTIVVPAPEEDPGPGILARGK